MDPWGHETCGARRTGVGKHFYEKVKLETPFSRRELDLENFFDKLSPNSKLQTDFTQFQTGHKLVCQTELGATALKSPKAACFALGEDAWKAPSLTPLKILMTNWAQTI